jgi:hypothetical protein
MYTAGNKKAMTTAIIIGLFMVIFILFYSLSNMLRHQAYTTGRYLQVSMMANLADAGCAVGLNELEAQLNDQKSKVFQALYSIDTKGKVVSKLSEKTGEKIEYTHKDFKALDDIVKNLPGAKVDIAIEIRYLREFLPEGHILGNDREKIGVAEVISKAYNSLVSQTIREKRNIKITCSALPVVSRFSFYLREANMTPLNQKVPLTINGASKKPSSAFNLIEVKENGSGSFNGNPVIVNNSAAGEHGWVFLGGKANGAKPEDPILINLAGGATEFGEDHHIFRAKPPQPPPASCYLNKNVGNSGRGVKGNNPAADEAAFYDVGFSDDIIACDNLVNLNSLVNEFKPQAATANDKAYSSIFHFFGSAKDDNNENNVMLGNVWRAYSVLGIFRCDKQGGNFANAGFFRCLGSSDYAAEWAKAKDGPCGCLFCQEVANTGNQNPPKPSTMLPTDPWPPGNHKLLTTEQYAMWKFDLKTYQEYCEAMSQVKVDNYFESSKFNRDDYKELLKPDDKNHHCSVIPGSKANSEFFKNVVKYQDYAQDQSLNDFGFTNRYFSSVGRMTMRITKKSEADEFWKESLQGGVLKLGKVVVFADDLTIPAISDIERGGIIVCEKDITIQKIDFKGRKDLSQKDKLALGLLTVVSLGGKITIKGGPICAQLVSLQKDASGAAVNGEIVLETKSLDIFGGMAVNKIKLSEFLNMQKKGDGNLSSIEYNPMLYPNPDTAGRGSYLTNEYAYAINLMPTIEEWTVTSEW